MVPSIMMLVYLITNIKINANMSQLTGSDFDGQNNGLEILSFLSIFLADLHEVGQLLELAMRILVGGSIRWDLFLKKSNIYFLYGIIRFVKISILVPLFFFNYHYLNLKNVVRKKSD